MNQEELILLKSLLEKASQVMPANSFKVQEKDGNLILVGESSEMFVGGWDEWRMSPEGEVSHTQGCVN